ncbi:unnamed protein product [Protopolystoma xenopodis]|uniref:Uncharacterized protein n=1 Tax=Protopolystoma xenopodis TaxID=117903 RepID=A0A3S5FG79_9PLAT|nr:unnamed protein product [Protopolystoma xenopodis]
MTPSIRKVNSAEDVRRTASTGRYSQGTTPLQPQEAADLEPGLPDGWSNSALAHLGAPNRPPWPDRPTRPPVFPLRKMAQSAASGAPASP